MVSRRKCLPLSFLTPGLFPPIDPSKQAFTVCVLHKAAAHETPDTAAQELKPFIVLTHCMSVKMCGKNMSMAEKLEQTLIIKRPRRVCGNHQKGCADYDSEE